MITGYFVIISKNIRAVTDKTCRILQIRKVFINNRLCTFVEKAFAQVNPFINLVILLSFINFSTLQFISIINCNFIVSLFGQHLNILQEYLIYIFECFDTPLCQ